jgi:hypothetical protein
MSLIRIEAEDYISFLDKTSGNTGGAYRNDNVDIELSRDSNGGYSVGWISAGEYLTYTLDIPETGTYRLDARVASGRTATLRFQVTVDGQQTDFSLGNTGGWYSWQTISANQTVSLAAGSYQVRVDMLTDGFNLNYLDLVPVESTNSDDDNTDSPDDTGSSTNTPQLIRIQAEDYSSFFDKTSGNRGGAYRNDDVDIELSRDSNGGYSVGWISARGVFNLYP